MIQANTLVEQRLYDRHKKRQSHSPLQTTYYVCRGEWLCLKTDQLIYLTTPLQLNHCLGNSIGRSNGFSIGLEITLSSDQID